MSGDGLVRCPWAEVRPGPDAQLYRDYHDNEWGRPLYGRVALFERMSLEAFQSGLSWLIILRKRENFRRAFSGFDIDKIARYTDTDVRRYSPMTESCATAPRLRRRSPTRAQLPIWGRPKTYPSCCGRSRHRLGPGPSTFRNSLGQHGIEGYVA